jgi:hypothetical protein
MKQLEAAFPLAKAAEKDAKQLDVKIFLKFLKKHKLFGESLKQELAEIYDLLHESWELAEDIRKRPGHGKELEKLSEITYEIEKKNNEMLEKLAAGKYVIAQMGQKLTRFYNDERKILELLKEFYDGMKRMGKMKQTPHVTQLMDSATNIQGALHKIKPLFEAISTAYERDSIEIEKMIEEERMKIEKKVRGKSADPIDFRKLLEHVKYVEGLINDLITKAEEEAKLENVSKENARLMEIIIGQMLEKDLPGR